MDDRFTIGVPSLDRLIAGVRIGDNLVIQSHGGGPVLDTIVDRFVAARGTRPLVACTAGVAWPAAAVSGVTAKDLIGGSGSPPNTMEEARAIVSHLDEQVGGEALFVFWTLDAMLDAWGSGPSLDFFLWACPRLYRRGSVALWPMDPDRHSPRYLRRLEAITQVIIDLRADPSGTALQAKVVKADGRPGDVVGRQVAIDATSLEAISAPVQGDVAVGERVLAERTDRGISQAELARLVGISGPALSQLERGTRGVSADTITAIWRALGVPFGPVDPEPTGYTIARRGAQPAAEVSKGMTRRRLTAERDLVETWLIGIDPGAAGRGAPFPVKSPELVTVLSGVVDLDIAGHVETLHEGDSLVITTAALAGWANPGAAPAELHWAIIAS